MDLLIANRKGKAGGRAALVNDRHGRAYTGCLLIQGNIENISSFRHLRWLCNVMRNAFCLNQKRSARGLHAR